MAGRTRLFNDCEILIYVLSDLGLGHIEEEQYNAGGDTWAKPNLFHVKHIPLHRSPVLLPRKPKSLTETESPRSQSYSKLSVSSLNSEVKV